MLDRSRLSNLQAASDGDLIQRHQDGDGAALSVFFQRHSLAVRRRAFRILRSVPDTDDAVQSAYLRALKAASRIRSHERVDRWLLRIVTNVALDLARARSRTATSAFEDDAELTTSTHSPSDSLERQERSKRVWDVLQRLKTQDAQLLVRRHILGQKPRTISDAIDVPSGRVSTRLTRARYAFESAWESTAASSGPIGN